MGKDLQCQLASQEKKKPYIINLLVEFLSNLNLIKLLDLTITLQEIEGTGKLVISATGVQSGKHRLWETLLDKQPSFLSKIEKRERWNVCMCMVMRRT